MIPAGLPPAGALPAGAAIPPAGAAAAATPLTGALGLRSCVAHTIKFAAISGISWGARSAVQVAATQMFLQAFQDLGWEGGLDSDSGAGQRLLAETLGDIACMPFVGVVHGLVENVGNRVIRMLDAGDGLFTGAPNNAEFKAFQKDALPMGWALQAAVRQCLAQLDLLQGGAVTSEDIWEADPTKAVLLTVMIGVLVQGVPFYKATTAGAIPGFNVGANLWERSHAAFDAETHVWSRGEPLAGLLPLAVWQGGLNTTLAVMKEHEVPPAVIATIALVGTFLIHHPRIASFMANKGANEAANVNVHPSAAREAMHNISFGVMMLATIASISHIQNDPSEAASLVGEHPAMVALAGVGAGMAVDTALSVISAKVAAFANVPADSKTGALISSISVGLAGFAGAYVAGSAGALAATTAAALWHELVRPYYNMLNPSVPPAVAGVAPGAAPGGAAVLPAMPAVVAVPVLPGAAASAGSGISSPSSASSGSLMPASIASSSSSSAVPGSSSSSVHEAVVPGTAAASGPDALTMHFFPRTQPIPLAGMPESAMPRNHSAPDLAVGPDSRRDRLLTRAEAILAKRWGDIKDERMQELLAMMQSVLSSQPADAYGSESSDLEAGYGGAGDLATSQFFGYGGSNVTTAQAGSDLNHISQAPTHRGHRRTESEEKVWRGEQSRAAEREAQAPEAGGGDYGSDSDGSTVAPLLASATTGSSAGGGVTIHTPRKTIEMG